MNPIHSQRNNPKKGRGVAPLSDDRNGGGGAVTPAAGPALESEHEKAIRWLTEQLEHATGSRRNLLEAELRRVKEGRL